MTQAMLGYTNIVPLLAPVDIASTATTTGYVDCKYAHKVAFFIPFGLITSATTTDREVITVECATAVDGAEAAIAFSYRVGTAAGTDVWGAITACAATGLGMDPANDDGKAVWIEVDPGVMAASNYRYARVVLTDTPDMTACLVAVYAFLDVRYAESTHLTATASASA